MRFKDFQDTNFARAMESGSPLTTQYFIIAMGGEAGETLNKLKKYMREDPEYRGIEGIKKYQDDVAEECADVITYAFLLLSTLDRDAAEEVMKKFEKVNRRLAAGGFDARPEQDK